MAVEVGGIWRRVDTNCDGKVSREETFNCKQETCYSWWEGLETGTTRAHDFNDRTRPCYNTSVWKTEITINYYHSLLLEVAFVKGVLAVYVLQDSVWFSAIARWETFEVGIFNLCSLGILQTCPKPRASPGAPELRMESFWVEELKRLTKHIFTMWYVRLLCRLGRKLSFTEVEYPKFCSRVSDLFKANWFTMWFRVIPWLSFPKESIRPEVSSWLAMKILPWNRLVKWGALSHWISDGRQKLYWPYSLEAFW